jgi:catechol 2,3-dioxygenase-like lactoylglutathione lyase family enzyme
MKPLCLLMSLVLPFLAAARPPVPMADDPALSAIGAFLALSVADIDASARWYSEKLGLKVTMRTSKTNGARATVLEGGGLVVELVEHDAARPLSAISPGVKESLYVHGIFKAGVIVSDFEKTLALLKARNAEIAFGPYPARADQRANVIVRDNAGNLIQFFGK